MGNEWFDEISFDPAAPLLQMGTRRLGFASWLIADEHRSEDLALKRELLSSCHNEVFAVHSESAPGADAASTALLAMVRQVEDLSDRSSDASDIHPLEQAARLIQEDLCLIHLRDGTWHLDAASLCFPSRWRLADKIGRPLVQVHSPVGGYDPVLADRVNKAFDHLLDRPDDRPVWRRNWFIHPNPDRYQPSSPRGGDPVVAGGRALTHLWMRSERQVLRRVLAPDWAVFSIKIQQASLAELFVTEGRQARVAQYLSDASAGDVAHHGVSAAQRIELLDAL